MRANVAADRASPESARGVVGGNGVPPTTRLTAGRQHVRHVQETARPVDGPRHVAHRGGRRDVSRWRGRVHIRQGRLTSDHLPVVADEGAGARARAARPGTGRTRAPGGGGHVRGDVNARRWIPIPCARGVRRCEGCSYGIHSLCSYLEKRMVSLAASRTDVLFPRTRQQVVRSYRRWTHTS